MSAGGRAAAREKMVRRSAFMAAALVVLALVFLLSGHWVFAIVLGVAAVGAIWAFRQIRAVR